MNEKLSPPRIVCAAIKRGDGLVVACARHYDPGAAKVIGAMHVPLRFRIKCFITRRPHPAHAYFRSFGRVEQGFIDQHNRFYSREEAWIIAEKNGQIRRNYNGPRLTLFSEDLY